MSVYLRKLSTGDEWYVAVRWPPTRHGKVYRERVGPGDEGRQRAKIRYGELLMEFRHGHDPALRKIVPRLFDTVVVEFMAEHVGVQVEARKVDGDVQIRRCEKQTIKPRRKDVAGFISTTNVLLRHFGGRTLQNITPRLIEGFRTARLAEGISKPTVNRQVAVLSSIFSWAIAAEQFGGENPARKVERFDESPARERVLTADEYAALLTKAADHLKPILQVAVFTGARRREILTLRRRDIDLDRGLVHFSQTNTKSGRYRAVPIHPTLAAVLRDLLAQQKVRSIAGDELVFTYSGRAIQSIKTAFKRARHAAGIGPEFVFHGLRHCFATWARTNGCDLGRLQEYLGHSDGKLTRRYAKAAEEYLQAGVASFGPPPAPKAAAGSGTGTGETPGAGGPPTIPSGTGTEECNGLRSRK
jgi:integrase